MSRAAPHQFSMFRYLPPDENFDYNSFRNISPNRTKSQVKVVVNEHAMTVLLIKRQRQISCQLGLAEPTSKLS